MSAHGRTASDATPDLDAYASIPSSDPSCEGRSAGHPSELVGVESPTGAPPTALKLLLTNSQASALIGKRGAQIRTIQSSSGARVKIANTGDCFPGTNDRAVLISGSHECVASALDLVLNRLYTELAIATRAPVREALSLLIKVVFPAIAAGLVIGKGGDVLKHLRSTTGASLQLLARDSHPFLAVERYITIVGNLDHVLLAAHAIFDLLQAEPERSAYTHASVSYLPTTPSGSHRPPIAGSPWSGQSTGFSAVYLNALSTPTPTPQITPDKVSTGFFSQATPVLAPYTSEVATSVVTATSSMPRVFAEPVSATLAPTAYPDKAATVSRLAPIDTAYPYPAYGTVPRGYAYPGTPTYAQSPSYAYGTTYSYGYPPRDPRTSYRYGWVPSPTATPAPVPVCPNKLCQYGCACTSDTLLVPDGLVGVVFGKGGSSLQWLQQSTHTKISLASRHHADSDNPMRTLTFIGSAEGVAHAKLVISTKITEAQKYGRGAPAATPTSASSVDADMKSNLKV